MHRLSGNQVEFKTKESCRNITVETTKTVHKKLNIEPTKYLELNSVTPEGLTVPA
jgi:hypothetical protein